MGHFMSNLSLNPHPTYARCCGKCDKFDICELCKNWSVEQWEQFVKKCKPKKKSYSQEYITLAQSPTAPLTPVQWVDEDPYGGLSADQLWLPENFTSLVDATV